MCFLKTFYKRDIFYFQNMTTYNLIKDHLILNYLCCNEFTMLKALLQFGELSPVLRNTKLLRTRFIKKKFAVKFSSYKPLLPKSNKGIREV